MNSTRTGAGEPDSRYLAWLGQVQYVRRLPEQFGGAQLVLRSDLQLASQPLLGLEQYSLGGLRTVRGYRENQLVRDNGWSSSAELQIPVWRDDLGRPIVTASPFIDMGKAWNKGPDSGPNTLASAGMGLRYSPRDWIVAELYWGGRLRHVSRRGNDIQNNGFHFRVQVAL